MNTEQLIEYLASGEKDASELLDDINPRLKGRFLRACKNLAKIVDEVRGEYPDAFIYVQEDTPMLMLGNSHILKTGEPLYELEACCSHVLHKKIDGGGW